jgi:glutamyl-Q tRNA(Asp) synthetase
VTQPVFRFAPSPNGRLHLGHAYSALLNEAMAREAGGRLLLRIEDTDTSRCKPEWTQHIIEDLRWLGLTFADAPRIQSEHFYDYDSALQVLWQMDVIYPCFCSRSKSQAQTLAGTDPDGHHHYGGTCRGVAPERAEERMQRGDVFGWRLKTEGTEASAWGDVMIAKRQVGSSYHIAVVVDDGLQGITHVVRGKDLETATPIHRLLQQRLGLAIPQYHHHALVLDDAGEKLSKHRGSVSIGSLREQGVSAEELRRHLGFGA